MIKKLIFDIDNTIIMWDEKENLAKIKEVIDLYNLDFDPKVISYIIEELEDKYDLISKEVLLNDINSYYNSSLGIDFVEKILEKQSLFGKIDQEVIDTLEYLHDKYELVILTNYFTFVQEKRLKEAGIRDYFTNIYGGDMVVQKPRKEAFLKAVGDFSLEECMMIGDNLTIDVIGAINCFLKAILYDYKNQFLNNSSYLRITKFTDLKNIL